LNSILDSSAKVDNTFQTTLGRNGGLPVFIRGGGFESIHYELGILALFATLLDVLAIVSYRKNG